MWWQVSKREFWIEIFGFSRSQIAVNLVTHAALRNRMKGDVFPIPFRASRLDIRSPHAMKSKAWSLVGGNDVRAIFALIEVLFGSCSFVHKKSVRLT
jgi:hypothetical protein